MKRWPLISLFGGLLCVSIAGHAQQCGYGVQDGGQCVPADQVPGYQDSLRDRQARPQQPQAIWATRWGAFAADEDTFSIGISENQTSKSAASDQAMRRCRSKGNSSHCKVTYTYYNGCGALAVGTHFFDVASDTGLSQADSRAMDGCSKGAADCKIAYHGCSLPVRIQ